MYIFDSTSNHSEKAVVLFFNGASFKKDPKTPAQFQHQAKYFSSKGMMAICVDYRNGADKDFLPTQAIYDVKSAVQWVRNNASDLGIDPNKIIVCGSSAGAYITVSAIMFDQLMDDHNKENATINHVPNALIVFSGVMDAVDIMRRRYPSLLDKAFQMSPIHNIKKCLPPTLWICGTSEIDFQHNIEFIELMKQAGNDIRLKTFEGMEHGFFNYGKHNNKYFHLTKFEIESYLRSMKFL
ncbi:alpha/beta hydrolase [Gracilibacillus sp. S3-1-1]|uniref:Alpha/beta hydrolase n=1 Tax=Gracilibacillus pellucidus TaxID=3095368 RepID=A0ACC6M259_9BACI|nr:alpha/beta hydrolase [Gracilibacillus sp. S3-1-1]MDX8044963.1 alpha/beta hydrolase [Gracilibacillus sp. S3-1-1]